MRNRDKIKKKFPEFTKNAARRRLRQVAYYAVEVLERRLQLSVSVGAATSVGAGLSFEPNVGQTSGSADFVARGPGYMISLNAGTATIALDAKGSSGGSALVTEQLVNGNGNAVGGGKDLLQSLSNYLTPNNGPTFKNIPNYGRVTYSDVFSDIDVTYYGTGSQLEYDFDVAPGANANQIALKFSGIETLSVDAKGNLVLTTPAGDLVQNAPIAYQTVNGIKMPVGAEYVLLGNDTAAFRLGSYNRDLPLVIDPTLVYGEFLGGSGNDAAFAVATDAQGDAFITGSTPSPDFSPISNAALQKTFIDGVTNGIHGSSDSFVTKLDPTGRVVWSTYFGGNVNPSSYETYVVATSLALHVNAKSAVDGVYIAGYEDPTTARDSTGNDPVAFVSKLSADGTAYAYWNAKYGQSINLGSAENPEIMNASGFSVATGIAVDSKGDAYVTGVNDSIDFATNGWNSQEDYDFDVLLPGAADGNLYLPQGMAYELSPNGTTLAATNIADFDGVVPTGIALGRDGSPYVVGDTRSTTLISLTAPPPFQPNNLAGVGFFGSQKSSGFVIHLTANLGAYVGGTYLGGASDTSTANGTFANAIAIAPSGNVVVVGQTGANHFPASNAFTGSVDSFVTEFNPLLTKTTFSKFIAGGQGDDGANDVAVDAVGDVFVTGQTSSSNFPLVGSISPISRGFFSAFVCEYNPDGSSLLYSNLFGGTQDDAGFGVAVDPFGNIFVAGATSSPDFLTAGPTASGYGGGQSSAQLDNFLYNYGLDVFDQRGAAAEEATFSYLLQPQSNVSNGGSSATDGFVVKFGVQGNLVGHPSVAIQGALSGVVVATFATQQANATANQFNVTVNWGDGTNAGKGAVISTSSTGDFAIFGNHTYTDPGAYPVMATVSDSSGNAPQTDADVTPDHDSQTAPSIAVDPTRPDDVVVVSTDCGSIQASANHLPELGGFYISTSLDGGAAWATSLIATGDDFPGALSEPRAVFDSKGHLFVAYLGAAGNNVVVLESLDDGKTFTLIRNISADTSAALAGTSNVDSFSIAAGPPSAAAPADGTEIAIAVGDGPTMKGQLVCFGISATGAVVGAVSDLDFASSALPSDIDVAVGPLGQVYISGVYTSNGSSSIGVLSTATPFTTPPANPVIAYQGSGGSFELPALSKAIDYLPRIVVDTNQDGHTGRIYLIYDAPVDNAPADVNNLRVYLEYSDNMGATWSQGKTVSIAASGAEFLPSIAIDPVTQNLAVSWYETSGAAAGIQTNYVVATSSDGGQTFSAPVTVSTGASTQSNTVDDSRPLDPGYGAQSGLAFQKGILYPAWADNDPALAGAVERKNFDIAVAIVGTVFVGAQPLTVAPLPINVTSTSVASYVVAQIRDPKGTADASVYQAMIDWGDGTNIVAADQIVADPELQNVYDVIASHAYTAYGAFTAQVAVTKQNEPHTYSTLTNVSQRNGSQSSINVEIDPAPGKGNDLFIVSNDEATQVAPNSSNPGGLYAAYSTNGGLSWSSYLLGGGTDGLPRALRGPKAAFDSYGNLWLTYESVDKQVVDALSTDAGQTFKMIYETAAVTGSKYQNVATGPGISGAGQAVYFSYIMPNEAITVLGGAVIQGGVTLAGLSQIGIPASVGNDGLSPQFAQLSVLKSGIVTAIWADPVPGSSTWPVYASNNLDGSGFGPHYLVANNSISGTYSIPAYAIVRSNATVAYANNGPLTGASYLVYTAPGTANGPNTQIVVNYAVKGLSGQTVVSSAPGMSSASNFDPSIAVDPVTGNVAISFESTLGDPNNLDFRTYIAVSDDGGRSFNVKQSSDGPTNVTQGQPYGTYNGLSFANGIVSAAWPDDSSFTLNNLDNSLEVVEGSFSVATLLTPPPVVTITNPNPIRAGERINYSFAKFTEADPNATPDDCIIGIDWGNGISSSSVQASTPIAVTKSGGFFLITPLYAYPQAGTYNIKITVTYKDGSSSTVSQQIVVNDFGAVNGTVHALLGVGVDQTLAVIADPDPAADRSDFGIPKIDWGDGTSGQGSLALSSNGTGFDIDGSHTYSTAGDFTVRITIPEIQSDTAAAVMIAATHDALIRPNLTKYVDVTIATFTIAVAYPTLAPSAMPAVVNAYESLNTGLVPVAMFTIDGPAPTSIGAYIAKIHWNDNGTAVGNGTITDGQVVLSGNQITVLGSFTYGFLNAQYGQPGANASVTLTDSTGNSYSSPLIVNFFEDDHLLTAPFFTPSLSGLTLNSATGLYYGTITIDDPFGFNNQQETYLVVLNDLPSGVTLANAASYTSNGAPVVLEQVVHWPGLGLPLPPVQLTFNDPSGKPISFTPALYAAAPTTPQDPAVPTSDIISVQLKSVNAAVGTAFTQTIATFTDSAVDPAGSYSAIVHWGDGTSSAGQISADPAGGFDVVGGHTYSQAGNYFVTVAVANSDGRSDTGTNTPAVVTRASGQIHYHVTIDTSSLAGQSGYLALQFNPVTSDPTETIPALENQTAAAAISNVVVTGGSLQAAVLHDGGALDTLTNGATLSNSGLLNRLRQAITFGSTVSFDVTLSGDAITSPGIGNILSPRSLVGSVFSAQLLASNAVTPLLSTDISGTVARVDLNWDGSTSASTQATTIGGPAATVIAQGVANVSDPSIVVTNAALAPVRGIAFSGLVATFTDPPAGANAINDVATIEWGDGATSQGVVTGGAGGVYNVSGAHTYSTVGLMDLRVVVANAHGDRGASAATNGAGGLQSVRVFSLLDQTGQTAAYAGTLATADLNGDGKPDLVIPVGDNNGPNHTSLYAVDVLLGNGDGTFAAPRVYSLDNHPTAATVADFGNGHLDLAVVTIPSTLDVLMGDGAGNFQPETSTPLLFASYPDAIVAADFNKDNQTDLAISGNTSTVILLGTGVGTFTSIFTAATYLVGTGDQNLQNATGDTQAAYGDGQILSADLRHHGNTDLVVHTIRHNGSGNVDSITVLLSKGDGTFAMQSPVSIQTLSSIAIGDLNGDQIPDLVVSGNNAVDTFVGNGNGTFTQAHIYAVNSANRVDIGDMNGDGVPDLVVADSVFSGTTLAPSRGFSVLLGKGDLSFQPATFYPGVNEPVSFVLADFNGDGRLDVAANAGGNLFGLSLEVQLGAGDGALTGPIDATVNPNLFISSYPMMVQPVDINKDGKMDLVTTDGINIQVLLGNGNGSFATGVDYSTTFAGDAFVLGHFGADNNLDLAEVIQTGSSPNFAYFVAILRGNGSGGFGSPTLYSLPTPLIDFSHSYNQSTVPNLALGDVNEDGYPDLVVGGPQGSILLGKADGTFQTAKTYDTPYLVAMPAATGFYASSSRVTLADFNGDTHLDIAAIGGEAGQTGQTDLLVNLGNGNGTFQTAAAIPVGVNAVSLTGADLRHSGRTDLVIADSGTTSQSGAVEVLLSNGDGTFQTPATYAIEADIRGVSLADVNGDGIADIIAVGIPSIIQGGVFVLYGKGNGTFSPPINYEANASDALSFVATADFNSDGAIDVVTNSGPGDQQVSVLLNATPAGIKVSPAPLTASGVTLTPTAGNPFTSVVATIGDPDIFAVAGDFVATISWGDGSGLSNGNVVVDPSGGFEVVGTHIYAAAGTYLIKVAIGDASGATASANSVATTGASFASSLAFGQQPGTVVVNSSIAPAVTVEIRDAAGKLDASDNSTVTLSLASGSGALGGTLMAQAHNGIAVFGDLSLSAIGTYQLLATDGELTQAISSRFTVGVANQAPTVLAPANVSLSENATLAFNGASSISIADADANGAAEQLTLAATGGDVSIPSVPGLQVVSGASGSRSLVLVGTIAQLNVALAGLVFTPPGNASDSGSLSISIDDLGNSGIGTALTTSASVAISINRTNQPPSIIARPTASVVENGALVFTGDNYLGVADADGAAAAEKLSLTGTGGTLTLASTAGLSVVSGANNSPNIVITGALTDLNAALKGLIYLPSPGVSGPQSLSIVIDDLGASGVGGDKTASATVGITIAAVDQLPAVTVPPTASVTENGKLTFSSAGADAIVVSDVDADGNIEQLSLVGTEGIVTLATTTGLSVVSGANNSASLVISGTLANLNAAISGLIFTPTPGATGGASLAVSLNDLGNTGAGGPLTAGNAVSISIVPVYQKPVTAPDAYDALQNQTLTVPASQGVLANDTNLNGLNLTATLVDQPTDGTVHLNADGSFTYVPYPPFNGVDTFTYEATDGVTTSAPQRVTITVAAVNQAPSFTAFNVGVNEDSGPVAAAGFATFYAGSPNESAQSVLDYQVSLVSNPDLFTTPPAIDADGTLTFTPAPGVFGYSTFNVAVQDNGGIANGGQDTSAQQTIAIYVNELNQAPTVFAPANVYVQAGSDVQFSNANDNAITVDDSDSSGAPELLSLSVTDGVLTLGSEQNLTFEQGTSDGSSSIVVSGTLADLNTALDGLDYQTSGNLPVSPTLSIDINDLGNTGPGDVLDASTNVNFTVSPDAPSPRAAADTYAVIENQALNVAAVQGVLANDADPIGLPLTSVLLIRPRHGSLTLNAGGSFSYVPSHDFSGTDSFSYVASDGQAASQLTAVTLNVSAGTSSAISSFAVKWGSQSSQLTSIGGYLLPTGRNTDLPWDNISAFSVILSQPIALKVGDISVKGIEVADYGPVTISGDGTTYVITLRQSISIADRVQIQIANAGITLFTGELNVLPGDVNDDGVVNVTDGALIRNNFSVASLPHSPYDFNGDGSVNNFDFLSYRPFIGTSLPVPPLLPSSRLIESESGRQSPPTGQANLRAGVYHLINKRTPHISSLRDQIGNAVTLTAAGKAYRAMIIPD